ncbi:MAG: Beta-barrel assembly-enhancing protease [Chlamydiae bacterium]|nr:Beta-barrel assembly-enhancing protease [Chlamydiota bacterium]
MYAFIQRLFEKIVQIFSFAALLAIVALIFMFLSQLPPPPTTPYNIAYLFYLDGNYEETIHILQPLVKANPDDFDAQHLLGQALLKNNNRSGAEAIFHQLLEKHPDAIDARIGVVEASLANNHASIAVPILEKLTSQYPHSVNIFLLLGTAYFNNGDNLKAAETYRHMIRENMASEEAQKRFLAIYGSEKYDKSQQLEFNSRNPRPTLTQVNARTHNDYFEVKENDKWQPIYLNGMNLSGAAPGYYVPTPPTEFEVYAEWLKLIADMNCNVVRGYNLFPPAFYQALKAHNERSEKKLWLFQEVWLHVRDPRFSSIQEAFDLYDPTWQEEFKNEIQQMIHALHGNANIPFRKGHAAGIYTADVSDYVIGIGLGKELETYIATQTNLLNPTLTSYHGRYVSMKDGNPTERWFAQFCDFTVDYEMTHYNAQHPITVVNAPQFDSIYHPSEASIAEQHKWEKQYGLSTFPFTRIAFETDVEELDVTKYTVNTPFESGLFACYHVYPHWPDFMYNDPKYKSVQDKEGPNPFYGYIRELKKHHENFPLLMGEYGVSTSWLSVYDAPGSINQGGYTEQEQADLLTRWSKNIQESKYAGGILFEFLDEWVHVSVNLTTFQNPETKNLWHDVLDGESNYGVITFPSSPPIPLLRGEKKDWSKASSLTSASFFKRRKPGDLKKVHAYSDCAYLYLRLDVEPWGKDEKLDWEKQQYWVALSTLPGQFGSELLPEIGVGIESGANILIQLAGENKGKILVSQNYNPFKWIATSPLLGSTVLGRKERLQPGVDLISPFEEILFPTKSYHLGRDGTIYPPSFANASTLNYGTADPSSVEFSNLSAWHVDTTKGMIEMRIPWLLMFVTDPPNRAVMFDIPWEYPRESAITQETPGIGVVAFSVKKEEQTTFQSLPEAKEGIISIEKMPLYTWKQWNKVPPYETRLKESYFSLQGLFRELGFAKGYQEGRRTEK